MSRLVDADELLNMRFSNGLNENGILYVPFREVMRNIKNAPTAVAMGNVKPVGSSPVGTTELFCHMDGHPCYVVRDEYGRIVISDELMRELIERASGSSTGGADNGNIN